MGKRGLSRDSWPVPRSDRGTAAFRLVSELTPRGDQPRAIEALAAGILEDRAREQALLGVTGSGKTFTMAQVVQRVQLPTLVLAPNKTLAAQLYDEFRALFPENAVEYFVSYYDYYQPEAYVPSTDTYIEKDASINDRIELLRNAATRSLLERRDVLIVASVSCIYGLGSPESYADLRVDLTVGQEVDRDDVLRQLASILYRRESLALRRGTFRSRGDVIEVFPVYEEQHVVRIELDGDCVEALLLVDPIRGTIVEHASHVSIFPANHYVTPAERLESARGTIEAELEQRVEELRADGRLLEAERLDQRTRYDLELLREVGTCGGIENYSRHLDGRAPGVPPATLLHYFPEEFLLFVDESHVTVPQVAGMVRGDRSRKQTLVNHGFRLPSALDNRPLAFEEFDALLRYVVYVSATPGVFERGRAGARVVEQVVRPTGLVDPEVEVRPARGQVDDLLGEIRGRVARKERVLVTTLTKRMAEDLSAYYRELGVRVRYLHADIDTLERTAILRDLRLGVFDVLVGINLLREGLDLPEVSLVAILDADKEGYLRSTTSLLQTFGRASRHVHGRAILYAETRTRSMHRAIEETDRRREVQLAHNAAHGIVPRSVQRSVRELLDAAPKPPPPFSGGRGRGGRGRGRRGEGRSPGIPGHDGAPASIAIGDLESLRPQELRARVASLRETMVRAAAALDFEEAARCRDAIVRLEKLELEVL